MEHFAQIRALVSQVREPHVRALLDSFLDDPELQPAFLKAPAAKRIHHAFEGGLCEHTLSVLELGWRICDHYPQLDRDLVTAGCLLHDIGKSRELSGCSALPAPPVDGKAGASAFEPEAFEYTEEGKLVGHLLLTCQLIREKAARIPGFPRELEWRITHLVAAHHGRREYGTPKEPVTLEAVVVHALDDLDTRMSSFGQLFAAAPPGSTWTDGKNVHGRGLLIAPPPARDDRRFHEPGLYRLESE